jgi:hypothetical protein
LSGNAVVGQMMTSLRGSIETYVLAAIPRIADWPTLIDKLRREHHTIVDAIAGADSDEASAAITRHIHEFYECSGLRPVDDAGVGVPPAKRGGGRARVGAPPAGARGPGAGPSG